ncbi:quaternary ammonium compound-resistance protein SugE [Kaistella chaponensis]|uniref:Guanidinium exporter n=1 Tax=Kaistella chaponensis TaxID=713588 RepID=A0A1N7MC51_9FLAO|nr:SMR family transporter [Kaistella chaponensis]SIS83551.1 quaternary ammonium compound-resistance protein SugE [Kaistella chaponensis]
MNWIILIIGGLFETAFATCLGKAQETTGKESYFWWGGFVISLFLSMFLLYKAISVGTNPIPIGTAYAVWTGIGAVGAVLMGIFVFNEPATFWRMFFVMALIASVVGLKLVSS